MSLFDLESRKQNLFGADCMKEFNALAITLGAISEKKNITNETLMKYGEIAIDFFLNQRPELYGGIDDFCENAFYFTVSLGIVLGARLRYDKLTHEYVVKAINESPANVGLAYLKLVGLEDYEHHFYKSMYSKFCLLYDPHKQSDKNREYLKRALIVMYAIGNTIALEGFDIKRGNL